MSREIKFRAWDIKNGIMNDDFYIHSENGIYDDNCRHYDTPNIEIIKCNDELEAMQYTGLKDKNGIEIYEGDIVEYKRHEVDTHYIGNIVFNKSSWRVVWNDKNRIRKDLEFWTAEREIEIIGNIYKNPELLEMENNNE